MRQLSLHEWEPAGPNRAQAGDLTYFTACHAMHGCIVSIHSRRRSTDCSAPGPVRAACIARRLRAIYGPSGQWDEIVSSGDELDAAR
jgi:hypothetical protein